MNFNWCENQSTSCHSAWQSVAKIECDAMRDRQPTRIYLIINTFHVFVRRDEKFNQ